jgi:hypothetical protein
VLLAFGRLCRRVGSLRGLGGGCVLGVVGGVVVGCVGLV